MALERGGFPRGEREAWDARLGLAAGVGAALLALAALPAVARVPFGLLVLDVAMAWGLVSLMRLASDSLGVPVDGWLLAFGAFLPVPFLVRFGAARHDFLLPAVLRHTWLLEVLVLGVALGLLVASHRAPSHRLLPAGPARLVALGGASLAFALLALALLPAPAPPRSALIIWGATALAGCLALLAQRFAAVRRRGQRFEVFGSAAALFLAGTQLLDGVVSYLSVRDPLGVLDVAFSEQVAVSAWLIENTGPGYVVVKWSLALVIVYVIDGKPWPARPDPMTRLATYLFTAFIGLGPGLFSATRLMV